VSAAAVKAGALAGITVLDLTRYIPGPYCTMLLGALGADVIKVEEPPFGDATRAVPPAIEGESVAFHVLNRNKRSIVVDLRHDDGVEIVRRLAAAADVFVEGFRPGALERRGLGADELRARDPRLVYCSLSGYGPEGPLRERAGHDVNYAARAGLLDVNRDAAGEPRVPGFQAADMAGGMLAALAILAALHARERTGEGQVVDVSLLGAALGLMTVPAARALAGGARPDELAGTHACYRVFRCRDGRHLSVGALEPKFWETLVEALELPELRGRQWESASRRDATAARLAETFARCDRDEWLARLEGRDVCVEPVLDPREALSQPQAAAYVVEDEIAGERLRSVGVPFRLAATPAAMRRPAPAPGQHTDEVLAAVGYAAAGIEALRCGGVIA
jgi:crotonobetainyl-CoA:carnitine CoA-transferase CaiB-like acyl-CoA transferase